MQSWAYLAVGFFDVVIICAPLKGQDLVKVLCLQDAVHHGALLRSSLRTTG